MLRATRRAPGGCARRAPLRGQAPSSSARLHERSCSQSERREAAEGRREQEAARDAPRSEAEGLRAARGNTRGAAHRAGGRELAEGRREAARDAPRSEAERRRRVGGWWWWRALARSPPRHRPCRRATASVSRRGRGWAGPVGSASAPCEEDSGAARARRRRIAASSARPDGSSVKHAGRACASCSPHSRTSVEAAPVSAPPMSSPCARRKAAMPAKSASRSAAGAVGRHVQAHSRLGCAPASSTISTAPMPRAPPQEVRSARGGERRAVAIW